VAFIFREEGDSPT